ncbi:MAG: DNA/RNA non-specific endonuclease, partial [Paludibacter sp.]|nr:DNA/RNA non-specific endonuclease [Paludibacter sp.]
MKKFSFLLSVLFCTTVFTFSQKDNVKTRLEIPELKPNECVINHSGFSLSYNEPNEQANWVAYELSAEETSSEVGRTNKFMMDPAVKTGSAGNDDYAGSGYDRGHLA